MPLTEIHVMKWERTDNYQVVEYQSRWGGVVLELCNRKIQKNRVHANCLQFRMPPKKKSDNWASDYSQRLKTAFQHSGALNPRISNIQISNQKVRQ